MAIINLVLAVGLAVDYSCHVAHSFVQMPATPGLSPRAQRQERTDRAVEEMGVAVVHGAVSTFLAVPTSPPLTLPLPLPLPLPCSHPHSHPNRVVALTLTLYLHPNPNPTLTPYNPTLIPYNPTLTPHPGAHPLELKVVYLRHLLQAVLRHLPLR